MRSPRRSFAAPFVITMVGAAGSAGFTSCNPPRQQRPDPVIATNPPPLDPNAGSGSDSDSDGGTDEAIGGSPNGGYTTSTAARPGEIRWTLFQQGRDCYTSLEVPCPQPDPDKPVAVSCNPPPAAEYACPKGVTFERPVLIARFANDNSCHLVPPAMTCPAGAICNPPPLRTVDCPPR